MSSADSAENVGVRRRFFALVFVFGLLAWASNAATLAFDRFAYGFSDPVSMRQLSTEIVAINLVDVGRSFFTDPFFRPVNLAMLVSLVAIAAVETRWPAHRRVVALTLTVLSVPIGLLALGAIVVSSYDGLDGEWLGESWPIFEAFFFWTLALCAYSLPERAQKRSVCSAVPESDPMPV